MNPDTSCFGNSEKKNMSSSSPNGFTDPLLTTSKQPHTIVDSLDHISSTIQTLTVDEDSINYDRCIQEPLGQFGPYSWFILLMAACSLTTSMATLLTFAFNRMTPTWTCTQPLPEDLSGLVSSDESYHHSTPENDCRCPPHGRNYSNVDNFFSIRRTFDLMCEHEYDYSLAFSLLMAGGPFGAIVMGLLADRYGRRPCLIGSLLGGITANVVYSFAGSYPVVCFTLFFMGFCAVGNNVVGGSMMNEFIGRDYRLLAGCANFGSSLTMAYMAGLGYIWNDWRTYQRAVAASQAVVVLMGLIAVESPRWLIRKNKLDAARKAIRKIAWLNRKPSPLEDDFHTGQRTKTGDVLLNNKHDSCEVKAGIISPGAGKNDLLHLLYQTENLNPTSKKNHSYADLFRHSEIRKNILIVMYMWFATGLLCWSIYGEIGSLVGSMYANFVIAGAVTFLGGLLPLVGNIWGGRRPLCFATVIIILVSFMTIMIAHFIYPEGGQTLDVVMKIGAFVGLVGMEPLWNINRLCASEMFPTVVRSQATGISIFSGRIGSMLAPQVVYFGKYYGSAPFILFTGVALVQLIVAYWGLPECKGKPLLDSLPPKHSNKK